MKRHIPFCYICMDRCFIQRKIAKGDFLLKNGKRIICIIFIISLFAHIFCDFNVNIFANKYYELNHSKKGKFKIEKVDENGKFLQGAEFTLTSENGIDKVLKVDREEMYFTNLEKGIYNLKETKAPDGYVVSNKTWKVTVEDDGFTKVTEEIDKDTVSNEYENLKPSMIRAVNNVINKDGLYHKDAVMDPKNFEYETKVSGEKRNAESYKNPNEKIFYNYKGEYNRTSIDVAGVNKYLVPTEKNGEYDVHLKVKGNKIEEKNKIGVVIVCDNSASMSETGGYTKTRFEAAKEATNIFIDELLKNSNVEVALVSYGSHLFNGQHSTNILRDDDQRVAYYEDYSHGFTKDAESLKNKLPKKALKNSDPRGGTYTALALNKAHELLKSTDKQFDKKFIVTITDGIPTFSPTISNIRGNNSSEADLDFTDENRKGVGFLYKFYEKGTFYNQDTKKVSFDSSGRVISIQAPGQIYESYDSSLSGTRKVLDNSIGTIFKANQIKNDGIEMHTVGIQIASEKDCSESEAIELMKYISSKDEYFYNTEDLGQLKNNLLRVLTNIEENTISNGKVIDSMGDQVILENNFSNGQNYVLTGYRNGEVDNALLKGVSVKYDEQRREFTVDGLNLGDNQWIELKYRVHLKTEENFKANTFFNTNNDATLYPNSEYKEIGWKFPKPSVSATVKSVTFKKEWQKINENLKGKVTFKLQRKLESQDNSHYVDVIDDNKKVISVTKDISDNNFEHTFSNLIIFNNFGENFVYRVIEENVPKDFDAIYEEKDSTDVILNREIPVVRVVNYPNKIQFVKQNVLEKPLENVEFKLEKEVSDSKYESVYGFENIKSEKDGKIIIAKLKKGKYRLIEQKALEGYIKPDDAVASFSVNDEGNFEDIKTNYEEDDFPSENIIVNKFAKIDLKVIKIDKDNKQKLLKGAVFELFKNNLKDKITNFDKVNINGKTSFETDEKGEVIIQKLDEGIYWLKEIKSPLGYRVNEDYIGPIEIKDGEVIYKNQEVSEIIAENEISPMRFYISKQNENSEIINSGVLVLELIDAKTGEKIKKEFNLESDYAEFESKFGKDKGLLFEIPVSFKSGNYFLREVVAPKGYQKLQKEFKLNIDNEKRTIEITDNENSKILLYREDKEQGKIFTDENFVIKNKKIVIPYTGSRGMVFYTLTGGILIIMSILFVKNKKES